jgi:1-acyl-sn-glycerol-3-phosphate acyltransferase
VSGKIKTTLKYFSIAFWLAFFIPFLYLFGPKNKLPRQLMCRVIVFCLGVKIKLEGSFDPEAKLLIMNHQSMLDIIAVEAVHELDLCWVSKKEITDYFYYGHINKAPKMISVDREDKVGLIKLLADVKDRVSQGRPVVIFPEGTRGKKTELLPFKPGAKMIAEKLGLKVQPVVVVDSARFLSPKGGVACGDLEIIVLPSFIPQKGTEWFEQCRAHIQEVLDVKRTSRQA